MAGKIQGRMYILYIMTIGMTRGGSYMKKIISISLFSLLIVLFLNTAVLKTYAYDYREDTLENSDDKETVMGLEEDIIRRSSGNTYSISSVGAISTIDFSSAVKVYLFDEDELLAFIERGVFQIEADRQYVWKIPIFENDEEYRYTIVGHDENGSYGFTNVISPIDVEKQVPYIFGDIGLESRFSNIEETYVVSIPAWNVDFVFVKDNGMNIIPYATRPDFFGFTNGAVYSPSDMKAFLEECISDIGTHADNEGGGSGVSISLHYKNRVFYAMGGVSVVVLMISLIVLIKMKRRERQK